MPDDTIDFSSGVDYRNRRDTRTDAQILSDFGLSSDTLDDGGTGSTYNGGGLLDYAKLGAGVATTLLGHGQTKPTPAAKPSGKSPLLLIGGVLLAIILLFALVRK